MDRDKQGDNALYLGSALVNFTDLTVYWTILESRVSTFYFLSWLT